MQNVKLRLDAWREAERHRDALASAGTGSEEAEEEVRTAEKAYRAELAQASVRYAEEEFQDHNRGWSSELDRRMSRARD